MGKPLQMTIMKRSLTLLIPLFLQQPFILLVTHHFGNLKCRTLANFRWYKDTFLTRVYTREDNQILFWKEKFLVRLPRLLGDKVRDKIHSQYVNRDIAYDILSYGQLISYVQKVSLKICQDDKIQRQLAKENAQTKKDLGSFLRIIWIASLSKTKEKTKPQKRIS